MATNLAEPAWQEIDECVEAFEAAFADGAEPDVRDFQAAPDHPLARRILGELIRVDMEFAWSRGQPRRVPEYCRRFPELDHDAELLREIAFEEYRQRREQGENPRPEEYERTFGISTLGWPPPFAGKRASSMPVAKPYVLGDEAEGQVECDLPPTAVGVAGANLQAVSIQCQRWSGASDAGRPGDSTPNPA